MKKFFIVLCCAISCYVISAAAPSTLEDSLLQMQFSYSSQKACVLESLGAHKYGAIKTARLRKFFTILDKLPKEMDAMFIAWQTAERAKTQEYMYLIMTHFIKTPRQDVILNMEVFSENHQKEFVSSFSIFSNMFEEIYKAVIKLPPDVQAFETIAKNNLDKITAEIEKRCLEENCDLLCLGKNVLLKMILEDFITELRTECFLPPKEELPEFKEEQAKAETAYTNAKAQVMESVEEKNRPILESFFTVLDTLPHESIAKLNYTRNIGLLYAYIYNALAEWIVCKGRISVSLKLQQPDIEIFGQENILILNEIFGLPSLVFKSYYVQFHRAFNGYKKLEKSGDVLLYAVLSKLSSSFFIKDVSTEIEGLAVRALGNQFEVVAILEFNEMEQHLNQLIKFANTYDSYNYALIFQMLTRTWAQKQLDITPEKWESMRKKLLPMNDRIETIKRILFMKGTLNALVPKNRH